MMKQNHQKHLPDSLRNKFQTASKQPIVITGGQKYGLEKNDSPPTSPNSCASKRCTLALSIKLAESFYGSHEMSKTFLEMLATVLQTPKSFSWDLQQCCKRQKVFRGTCNNVANAKKFFGGLATMLQTPKSFSGDLQQCCKRQKVFRGTCNDVANAKKFFRVFAAFLQTPKSFSRHLQRSCKHFQKHFGRYSALSKTFS